MDNRNKLLELSNLAFQMGVIISLGVFLGNYLDSKVNNQTPWWTLLLSIFSLSVAFYQVFKTIRKDE